VNGKKGEKSKESENNKTKGKDKKKNISSKDIKETVEAENINLTKKISLSIKLN